MSVSHKDVQANAIYVVLVILCGSVASQVLNRRQSYIKKPDLRENSLQAKPMQSSYPCDGNWKASYSEYKSNYLSGHLFHFCYNWIY